MQRSKISPLAELRKKAGITQRELANAFEVHHSLIASLEAGLLDIDDATKGSQIREVFSQLSELAGMAENDLVEKQADFTKAIRQDIRTKVKDQIRWLLQEWMGSELPDKEQARRHVEGVLRSYCEDTDQSPVRFFREKASISQRQMALAADVSQTLVARVETGELGLFYEPESGVGKLTAFLLEILGGTDDDQELWDALVEIQEDFRENAKQKAKAKVAAALGKIKNPQTRSRNDSDADPDAEEQGE